MAEVTPEDFILRLAARSNITEVQLESALLRQRIMSGELSSREALSLRQHGPVSLGAFYRVVGQAKMNLERSIFSVLIGVRLGLIRYEDIRRLLDLIHSSAEMDNESAARAASIVDALISKIVTL